MCTDQAMGLIVRMAQCFVDRRAPWAIEHSVRTLIGQRVVGIAPGYEDLNDHDALRTDPLWGALMGKLEAQRREWRGVGPGARVLQDDRRQPGQCAAARSDLRDARSRHRQHYPHAGPGEVAGPHRGTTCSALICPKSPRYGGAAVCNRTHSTHAYTYIQRVISRSMRFNITMYGMKLERVRSGGGHGSDCCALS